MHAQHAPRSRSTSASSSSGSKSSASHRTQGHSTAAHSNTEHRSTQNTAEHTTQQQNTASNAAPNKKQTVSSSPAHQVGGTTHSPTCLSGSAKPQHTVQRHCTAWWCNAGQQRTHTQTITKVAQHECLQLLRVKVTRHIQLQVGGTSHLPTCLSGSATPQHTLQGHCTA
jgi:hypothetical protein